MAHCHRGKAEPRGRGNEEADVCIWRGRFFKKKNKKNTRTFETSVCFLKIKGACNAMPADLPGDPLCRSCSKEHAEKDAQAKAVRKDAGPKKKSPAHAPIRKQYPTPILPTKPTKGLLFWLPSGV